MFEEIAQGVVLGISLAAPPGPVNAIIASRSLKSWKSGALVGFGALTADLIFMSITIYVGYLVPSNIIHFISIIGAFFLAWLAYGVFRSSSNYALPRRKAETRSYLTGLAMGLSNPFQIMWWMSVGVSLARGFGAEIFIGFVSGIVAWVSLFSLLVSRYGVSQMFTKGVKVFSFLTLSVFSAYLFIYGLRELI